MLRVDRDFFEYLRDLSNPNYQSSSELEAYEEKKRIVRIVLLTFLVASVVLVGATVFFIIYLPGLYNVTFYILRDFYLFVLFNWPIFVLFLILVIIFTIFYLRS
jgi:uncharacterized membrane protein